MAPRRALVISSLSLGTGAGLRAQYLARALQRLGWQVTFLEPRTRPLPLSAEVFTSFFRFALRAWGPYDLAVAIKPYPNAWAALAVARAAGAITVCDIDDLDSGYRGAFLSLLTRLLQAPARLFSDRFSTHHPLIKKVLEARLSSPPVVDLFQGVDLGIFEPRRFSASARRAWRATLGLQGKKVLLFCAHLNIACQFDELLQRLRPLLMRRRDLVLVVAGGGPLLRAFQRLARPLGEVVRFTGALSPDDVALAMASADAGVSAYGPSPANQYRVPMKVAEYLAMGLPCATEMLPGLKDLEKFVEGSAGGSPAFQAAARRALAGRARARRGQVWVRRHLGWNRVAQRFLSQLGQAKGIR